MAARPARKVSPAQASRVHADLLAATDRLDQLQRAGGADRGNAEQEGEARAVRPVETKEASGRYGDAGAARAGMSASAWATPMNKARRSVMSPMRLVLRPEHIGDQHEDAVKDGVPGDDRDVSLEVGHVRASRA